MIRFKRWLRFPIPGKDSQFEEVEFDSGVCIAPDEFTQDTLKISKKHQAQLDTIAPEVKGTRSYRSMQVKKAQTGKASGVSNAKKEAFFNLPAVAALTKNGLQQLKRNRKAVTKEAEGAAIYQLAQGKAGVVGDKLAHWFFPQAWLPNEAEAGIQSSVNVKAFDTSCKTVYQHVTEVAQTAERARTGSFGFGKDPDTYATAKVWLQDVGHFAESQILETPVQVGVPVELYKMLALKEGPDTFLSIVNDEAVNERLGTYVGELNSKLRELPFQLQLSEKTSTKALESIAKVFNAMDEVTQRYQGIDFVAEIETINQRRKQRRRFARLWARISGKNKNEKQQIAELHAQSAHAKAASAFKTSLSGIVDKAQYMLALRNARETIANIREVLESTSDYQELSDHELSEILNAIILLMGSKDDKQNMITLMQNIQKSMVAVLPQLPQQNRQFAVNKLLQWFRLLDANYFFAEDVNLREVLDEQRGNILIAIAKYIDAIENEEQALQLLTLILPNQYKRKEHKGLTTKNTALQQAIGKLGEAKLPGDNGKSVNKPFVAFVADRYQKTADLIDVKADFARFVDHEGVLELDATKIPILIAQLQNLAKGNSSMRAVFATCATWIPDLTHRIIQLMPHLQNVYVDEKNIRRLDIWLKLFSSAMLEHATSVNLVSARKAIVSSIENILKTQSYDVLQRFIPRLQQVWPAIETDPALKPLLHQIKRRHLKEQFASFQDQPGEDGGVELLEAFEKTKKLLVAGKVSVIERITQENPEDIPDNTADVIQYAEDFVNGIEALRKRAETFAAANLRTLRTCYPQNAEDHPDVLVQAWVDDVIVAEIQEVAGALTQQMSALSEYRRLRLMGVFARKQASGLARKAGEAWQNFVDWFGGANETSKRRRQNGLFLARYLAIAKYQAKYKDNPTLREAGVKFLRVFAETAQDEPQFVLNLLEGLDAASLGALLETYEDDPVFSLYSDDLIGKVSATDVNYKVKLPRYLLIAQIFEIVAVRLNDLIHKSQKGQKLGTDEQNLLIEQLQFVWHELQQGVAFIRAFNQSPYALDIKALLEPALCALRNKLLDEFRQLAYASKNSGLAAVCSDKEAKFADEFRTALQQFAKKYFDPGSDNDPETERLTHLIEAKEAEIAAMGLALQAAQRNQTLKERAKALVVATNVARIEANIKAFRIEVASLNEALEKHRKQHQAIVANKQRLFIDFMKSSGTAAGFKDIFAELARGTDASKFAKTMFYKMLAATQKNYETLLHEQEELQLHPQQNAAELKSLKAEIKAIKQRLEKFQCWEALLHNLEQRKLICGMLSDIEKADVDIISLLRKIDNDMLTRMIATNEKGTSILNDTQARLLEEMIYRCGHGAEALVGFLGKIMTLKPVNDTAKQQRDAVLAKIDKGILADMVDTFKERGLTTDSLETSSAVVATSAIAIQRDRRSCSELERFSYLAAPAPWQTRGMEVVENWYPSKGEDGHFRDAFGRLRW